MRKNILYIEYGSGFGGSAKSLSLLVKHLDRSKFVPIIAVRQTGPHLSKLLDTEIITLRHCWWPNDRSYLQSIWHFLIKGIPAFVEAIWLLKKRRVNTMHLNSSLFEGIPYILAARMAGIPCVCHLRLTRDLVTRERFVARLVDRFIVINQEACNVYGKYIPRDKISLVYNGLDLGEYTDVTPYGLKTKYGFGAEKLVGLVGRIVEGKGHKEFVRAVAELLRRKVPVKAFIMGAAKGDDPGYAQEVRELVSELRLEQDVIFTGWIEDIRGAMAELDIVVQATTTFPEGFGLTIIEAMALKKPVVATNIPGPVDIVLEGETGYLVSPGDVQAMADKIEYLIRNPAEAERMGQAGRRRVEECFEIKRVVAQVQNIYSKILGI